MIFLPETQSFTTAFYMALAAKSTFAQLKQVKWGVSRYSYRLAHTLRTN